MAAAEHCVSSGNNGIRYATPEENGRVGGPGLTGMLKCAEIIHP